MLFRAPHNMEPDDRLYFLLGKIVVGMHNLSNVFDFGGADRIEIEKFDRRRKAWLIGMRQFATTDADRITLERLNSRIVKVHHIRDALVHGGPSFTRPILASEDPLQAIVICRLPNTRRRYKRAYLDHLIKTSGATDIRRMLENAEIAIGGGRWGLEVPYTLDELENATVESYKLAFDIMDLNRSLTLRTK